MNLDKFIKVKKKSKTKKPQKPVDWKQIMKSKKKNDYRSKTYKVIKDIDLMAIDNEGNVYPEVLRVGDVISGERFDEKFLELLLKYGVVGVEEIKRRYENGDEANSSGSKL